MTNILQRLGPCVVPVDTEFAVVSHAWLEPVIGETVARCRDCGHVITLDEAWTADDALQMAQVEVEPTECT